MERLAREEIAKETGGCMGTDVKVNSAECISIKKMKKVKDGAQSLCSVLLEKRRVWKGRG